MLHPGFLILNNQTAKCVSNVLFPRTVSHLLPTEKSGSNILVVTKFAINVENPGAMQLCARRPTCNQMKKLWKLIIYYIEASSLSHADKVTYQVVIQPNK